MLRWRIRCPGSIEEWFVGVNKETHYATLCV